jgi:hypothetical protein
MIALGIALAFKLVGSSLGAGTKGRRESLPLLVMIFNKSSE